jgi:hypothetical protein
VASACPVTVTVHEANGPPQGLADGDKNRVIARQRA